MSLFVHDFVCVCADFRLDGILHSEWRTRLLTKMDYNINELLQDLMQASTVHPGDVSCLPSTQFFCRASILVYSLPRGFAHAHAAYPTFIPPFLSFPRVEPPRASELGTL